MPRGCQGDFRAMPGLGDVRGMNAKGMSIMMMQCQGDDVRRTTRGMPRDDWGMPGDARGMTKRVD